MYEHIFLYFSMSTNKQLFSFKPLWLFFLNQAVRICDTLDNAIIYTFWLAFRKDSSKFIDVLIDKISLFYQAQQRTLF